MGRLFGEPRPLSAERGFTDRGKMTRPTFDEYWMQFARVAGSRGTCSRGQSGAVIVKGNRILGTGYVGAPHGLQHCDEVGHLIHKSTHLSSDGATLHDHCIRSTHAEMNTIIHAARPILSGGTLYCKMEPCHACCVAIINAGVRRVIAEYSYHGAELTRAWFNQAGVKLIVLNREECY